jgi:hypothetical protein
MDKTPWARAFAALTSLKLTIAALAVLMVLVFACTLAQVSMGTLGAVNAYIRCWFVWWRVPGTALSIAVFPGGALAGAVLLANLMAAQVNRLERSWRKVGLWITHAGLILLFVGEFVTGLAQVESRMAITEGETASHVERPREFELALVDATDPAREEVFAVPEALLRRGGRVALPGLSLALDVKKYLPNASLRRRADGEAAVADRGVGAEVAVTPQSPVTRDDEVDQPAVLLEPMAPAQSYGTWLVSPVLGAPQSFLHEGRTYTLSLRNRRESLGYSITLKDFTHDVYPGTEIPKNFSSLVRLSNPAAGDERDVLISMNQPLRYGGKAFFQASFGKGDTLSVLQVVDNPGWLIPYISCALVTLGLLVHFAIGLRRGLRRAAAGRGTTAPAAETAVETTASTTTTTVEA